ERLERHGVLSSATGRHDQGFTIGPEVREALHERVRAQADIDGGEIHRKLIGHHIGSEEWNEALLQAIALGEPVVLAEVVERCWPEISVTRRRLFDTGLARLPERLYEERPALHATRFAVRGMALP